MYREALLGETTDLVADYITSIDADREIAQEVILTLIEHVFELYRGGVISKDKFCKIYRALVEISSKLNEILSSQDVRKYEDIHELVEKLLIDKVGQEVAGWIGFGRSRNDHVVTAHRLKLRKKLVELIDELLLLRSTLIDRAAEYAESPFIVYTHAQPAQVTTFGHYLLSVDECVHTHIELLLKVLEDVVNKSPLGSGPMAGTLAPIDREREARDLGFSNIVKSTIFAVDTRSYFTLTCSIIVNLLVELTRFVNDLMLYSHPNIDYIRLPDEHCATSSIMPHKRNPVTLEIFRARSGQAIGQLTSMFTILHSIGRGYYLDLQEITPCAWSILNSAITSIKVLRDLVNKVMLNVDKILEDSRKFPVTSAESAEKLALEKGMSFREAYKYLADHFRRGIFVHLLDPEEVVKLRKIRGSGTPEEVRRRISEAQEEVKKQREKLAEIKARIFTSVESLLKRCEETCIEA